MVLGLSALQPSHSVFYFLSFLNSVFLCGSGSIPSFQTRPCNILQLLTVVKKIIFR